MIIVGTHAVDIRDSIISCQPAGDSFRDYLFGICKPHYPVPCIPAHIGYVSGKGRPEHSPYIWLCVGEHPNPQTLWTFWSGPQGLVEEYLHPTKGYSKKGSQT